MIETATISRTPFSAPTRCRLRAAVVKNSAAGGEGRTFAATQRLVSRSNPPMATQTNSGDGFQSGRLIPGAALPPTRVLAAELGISRMAVVDAYANLKTDGYLEARVGAGTRVRPA